MHQLEFLFLGAPRLIRDGLPVQVDTRKSVALLAYLAFTGQSHRRDTLAGLLWPDYEPENARGALRRTLSTLNKALGGEGLVISREEIGIDPQAHLVCDLLEFHHLLRQARTHAHTQNPCPVCLAWLERAASLVRGEFLAGFTLRDSLEFDDWQFESAAQVDRDFSDVLERLAQAYTLLGRLEEAIQVARRLLDLDHIDEEAHRRLMRLYAQSGQRNEGLRQYRECVRILDRELGVAPLEETTQLYQEIMENRLPAQPPAAPTPAAVQAAFPVSASLPVLPAPALVGRSAEWDSMFQRYRSCGSGGFFLGLQGEAGIGKSRLADEFLAQVQSQGGAVITLRCYDGEQKMAYAPVIEVLRTLAARPEMENRLRLAEAHNLAEAARLQPALHNTFPDLPPLPPLDGPGAISRLLEGLRGVLLAILAGNSDRQPGVLFIDDLHWADAATLDWIAYLLRRLKEMPVMAVAAWRTGEPADDALTQMTAPVRQAGMGEVITLDRLSAADVGRLMQNAGLPELSSRLYEEAEGLPFLVVEYLHAIQAHTLTGGDAAWPIPETARGLIHSRLRQISETGRQLLTTAAVIGRSFDFDTLTQASGRSEVEAIEGLESLTGLGLIREQPTVLPGSPEYDFSHEKVRTLVYAETSLVRRRLLHRRVAEALTGRPRSGLQPGPSAGLIASHYHLAGQETLAADYYRLAGEHARAVFANREAIDAFRNALALGHPDMAGLYESIADLLTLSAEYAEAQAVYEKAAALAPTADLARLEQKIGDICHRTGAWELAESHFQSALDALEPSAPPVERARILAALGRTAYQRGENSRAWDLACKGLELAQDHPQALLQVHNVLGILARSEDDIPGALAHLETSLSLARELGDPLARVAALNNLALVQSDLGSFPQAILLEREALDLCIQLGDRHREAALLNNLADLHHRAGEEPQSMDYLKKAVVIFAQIGPSMQPEIWKLTEW